MRRTRKRRHATEKAAEREKVHFVCGHGAVAWRVGVPHCPLCEGRPQYKGAANGSSPAMALVDGAGRVLAVFDEQDLQA